MWLVVFPQVHHHVSQSTELVIVSTNPLDLSRNRGDPLRCVVLGGDVTTRAAVPEASVHEDGNAVVGGTRSGCPGRLAVRVVCRMPKCWATFHMQRSSPVSFVATRRMRSETSAVGVSGRSVCGTGLRVEA